jgi:Sulfotransferase family
VSAPVFILAPHRSFTSVTCAMLGQHPQLFGVPELNLFIADRMTGWWFAYSAGRGIGANGLVRTVAQLYFGEQNEETVELARAWIGRRLSRRSSSVMRELAAQVHPLALADKTPLNARPLALQRLHRAFPRARYLHLLRNPLTRAKSVTAALPQFHLSQDLVDPIERWYTIHLGIRAFLDCLPHHRWSRMRGEDLLDDPARHLRRIAAWLEIRTDREAIDAMLHPERSPFARFGPRTAPLGNDVEFLRDPKLRAHVLRCPSNMRWPSTNGTDLAQLPREVRNLALEFGYQ